MDTTRYWVIGGEYNDLTFDRLVDGTEHLAGPFPLYDHALQEWRRLSDTTRSSAHHRYDIVGTLQRRSVSVSARPV
jgi:hypothetical protein